MKRFFKIVLIIGLTGIILSLEGCSNLEKIFPILNQPPVIVSNPLTAIEENQLYSYQIQAEDPERDTLNYTLLVYPQGMSINRETGLITWLPDHQQIGVHQVIIEVSDGRYKIQQNFEVEVVNLNDPPQIISYLPANLDMEIIAGEAVKFEIQANDLDKDSFLKGKWFINGKLVSYSSAKENRIKTTYEFFSSPGDNESKIIKGLISDGELSDSIEWKIKIRDITPPQIPTLNPIISPTNVSPQLLSGTKEANSSILINGIEIIALDDSTDWSYPYYLTEGINHLSITSRDLSGNESEPLVVDIKYDLNIYVDATNTNGIEDGTETCPFNTISEGIEAAIPGKSVMVKAGIYNEQLIISKEVNLQGEGMENTFITGAGFSGSLITLEANSIIISNFCLDGQNSTEVGIFFEGCNSIHIKNNRIINQHYGVKYLNSSPLIEKNSLDHNGYSGIEIGSGGKGQIENNLVQYNQYGIRTYGDASPEISGNNISSNSNTGIYCRESATPIIFNNTIRDNSYGVLIDYNSSWGSAVNPDLGGGDSGGIGGNNISGNKNYGVYNKTNHLIKAEYNWWGDTKGPKYPGNNSSAGDWVYWNQSNGVIDFEPWLSIM